MIMGPLSRVMMVRQPFCSKNMQNSHFMCATFSPAHAVPYFQLTWALLWSNRTAQRFNTTAGVQKLCHRKCSETIAPQVLRNYGSARWFYRPMWCHSFWTPAVVLNRCAVLLDHDNARFSCKYRTALAGLNFSHKTCEVCILFAQNGCLTIINLLRGSNIIIWSHVLCQAHYPFKLSKVCR